ncbi:hypothetical protein [Nocardioides nitrophenolicus]|uniref:hypothetical protein n=1 Tax=Nocardioides nitrophenolicus TaxID=60489 RepID=UPI00195647D7|nr:hypothetical protein [Nocardioides nitrophenolicus]MBM7517439.1 hypothetical protein [Nocardioides nitrophenolicus]
MGLLDKLKSAFTGPEVDVAAEVTAIEPGLRVIGHTRVVASAFERGGGVASGPNKLLGKAVDAAATAASGARHVGGDDDGIARSLPRTADLHVLVLAEQGLSLWDFGMMANSTPPDPVASVPREAIASIADTGKKAQGGVTVARVSFTDGSFFDYRIMAKPDTEFWEAVARF